MGKTRDQIIGDLVRADPVQRGHILRTLREERGFSLEGFAAKLGISTTALGNIESGRRTTPLPAGQLSLIADILSLPNQPAAEPAGQERGHRQGINWGAVGGLVAAGLAFFGAIIAAVIQAGWIPPPSSWNLRAVPGVSTTRENLAPSTVMSWCSGADCRANRFEQAHEQLGTDRQAVHLITGDPVGFKIPDDIRVQVWDCFEASELEGPAHLPQVCEALFTAQTELAPSRVLSWCAGENCLARRFEQATVEGASLDSSSVYMLPGAPVALDIPNEITVIGSNCTELFQQNGPAHLPSVCEAFIQRR